MHPSVGAPTEPWRSGAGADIPAHPLATGTTLRDSHDFGPTVYRPQGDGAKAEIPKMRFAAGVHAHSRRRSHGHMWFRGQAGAIQTAGTPGCSGGHQLF